MDERVQINKRGAPARCENSDVSLHVKERAKVRVYNVVIQNNLCVTRDIISALQFKQRVYFCQKNLLFLEKFPKLLNNTHQRGRRNNARLLKNARNSTIRKFSERIQRKKLSRVYPASPNSRNSEHRHSC